MSTDSETTSRTRDCGEDAANMARSRRKGLAGEIDGNLHFHPTQLFLAMDRRYPSNPALFSPGAPSGERSDPLPRLIPR